MKRIHAIIFNWPGQTAKAETLERLVTPAADRLDVINCDESANRPGWINLDNEAYYGRQFTAAMAAFDGDILLQIQADASCDDWPRLVQRFKSLYERDPRVGLVAPEVDYTPYDDASVELMKLSEDVSLIVVTDCVVWAMDRRVVDYLRRQPLHLTPLGYGIDWAAAIFCYRSGLLVMRDHSLKVLHPRGSSSYPRDQGHQQMYAMLNKMDIGDRQLFALLTAYASQRRALGPDPVM